MSTYSKQVEEKLYMYEIMYGCTNKFVFVFPLLPVQPLYYTGLNQRCLFFYPGIPLTRNTLAEDPALRLLSEYILKTKAQEGINFRRNYLSRAEDEMIML